MAVLAHHGVGELGARGSGELRRLPGVGAAMHGEIRHRLAVRGWSLAPHVQRVPTAAPMPGDPEVTLDALGEHGFLGVRAANRLEPIGATTVAAIASKPAEELVEGTETVAQEVRGGSIGAGSQRGAGTNAMAPASTPPPLSAYAAMAISSTPSPSMSPGVVKR